MNLAQDYRGCIPGTYHVQDYQGYQGVSLAGTYVRGDLGFIFL